MWRAGDEEPFAGYIHSSSVRFFFAFLTLTRFSINLGFLDRPLTIGLVWGFLTGNIQTGLALGVFFELFGLDYLAAGSYLPPNPLFPLLASLLFMTHTNISEPGQIAVFALWGCPLAYAGSYVEQKQRVWQRRGYTELIVARRSRDGLEKAARRRILTSMLQLFASSFIVFIVAANLWYALYLLLSRSLGQLPRLPGPPWLILACLASVGAVLALRTRRSLATFGLLCTTIAVYCLLLATIL